MNRRKQKTARAIAVNVLNRFDPSRNLAKELLNSAIEQLERVSQRQRATDLVFGTERYLSAIDTVIAKLADCPIERIQAKIINVIRVGCYELLFCPQRPEYSIVDESVEMVKAAAGRKQRSFVNWVLREITRQINKRQVPLAEGVPTKTIPQSLHTGCELKKDILPDPADDVACYLSTAFNLPLWLIQSWLSNYGLKQTRQVCFASNRRPSIYIRPNPLKTTIEKIAEQLQGAGIEFHISEDDSMIQIKGGASVKNLPGFEQGDFTVQDITAAIAVRLLKPKAGQKILDMCAAPGTKTAQLAEISENKATIIAADIDYDRLGMVEENSIRSGLKNIIVPYKKVEKIAAEYGAFDCILIDVPCSNTGVLSKRLEVRFRVKPESITKLAKTQMELLRRASEMIKPGGKICYSTCSIQKDENRQLVEGFLAENPEFKLKCDKLTLPSADKFDCDGGYTAVIKAG